ncbi:MAG TPA: cytochrome c [Pyrinomonadaceae bacterium]|jgi:mono/diheme cytochrome c family protein
MLNKSTVAIFIVVGIGALAIAATSMSASSAAARTASQLYARNCASCHGRDGSARTMKARQNHARKLSDPEWQDRVSDERIFNSIMNGKGKMPGYSRKLSEQEINSLVSYVRGLKR